MLLTLTANAMRSRLAPKKARGAQAGDLLALNDLPRFTRDELGLYGINLSTNLLVGADLRRLDQIRDAADKASCPCLVLTESEVQPFGTDDDALGDTSVERVKRVVQAAHRLGCNSIGLAISGGETEETYDFAIERLRGVLQIAERLEINILLRPSPGITAEPERLTDFIKKVGGFRIGTLPDYEAASKAADPTTYLRRITPYASAVTATVIRFKAGKKPGEMIHDPYDLAEFTRVVKNVGYQGTLSIDYRGDEDPVAAIKTARGMLESVVGPIVTEPVAEIDPLLEAVDAEEVEDEESDEP